MRTLFLKVKHPSGDGIYSTSLSLDDLVTEGNIEIEKYGYIFEFIVGEGDASTVDRVKPKTIYLEDEEEEAKTNELLKDISDGKIDTKAYEEAALKVLKEKEQIKSDVKSVDDILKKYDEHKSEKEQQIEQKVENTNSDNKIPGEELIDRVIRPLAQHRAKSDT